MILFRIEYGFVYKISSKNAYKGSRIESIQDARKEYKKLLEECWKKKIFFKSIFKNEFKRDLNLV